MKLRGVPGGLAALVIMLFVGIQGQKALANNLRVTNVVMSAGDTGYTYAQFDISWDNSWRLSWNETGVTPSIVETNWDAAWIFVKWSATGAWFHATLSTNNGEHVAPIGSVINVGLSANSAGTNIGAGVFFYRSAEGSGSWTNTSVKLRWNYALDGLSSTCKVDISVHGLEMVYVPQGNFYVGDGTTANIRGQFCSNTTGTAAFQITNENYTITLGGGGAVSLGNNNAVGMNSADDFNNATPQTLPAAFPKGYNAFYCMKYEMSQGQWVSFFNMLSDSGNQKATGDLTKGRDITGGTDGNQGKGSDNVVNRNTVSWLGIGNEATCTAPNHAVNYMSWGDLCAYADWAGLRPITELEFEKACRGPLNPVADEHAWGSTAIADITGFSGTDGSGSETALPATANCNYNNNNVIGPTRCGIYATALSGRTEAGATYWGIMDMSGNLWERTVRVGKANGRAFTGVAGDGRVDATTGNANADYWPGAGEDGTIYRGGSWGEPPIFLRTSDRIYGADNRRDSHGGGRCVRTAP